MGTQQYEQHLYTTCNYDEINRLGYVIFKEGHLDRIDDLIVELLPLANLIYYKHIRYLDDREYAKEDLVSDAILSIYQDMKLRWDKYIHIDAYYSYFSTVLRNCMINLVHGYHNFYMKSDIDPESIHMESDYSVAEFEYLELKLTQEALQKNILETSTHLLQCRSVNTNLLVKILNTKYVDNADVSNLKTKIRTFGIPGRLFDFYCEHVDYVYKLAYNYHYASLGGKQKMIDRITSTISRFEDVTYGMLSAEYYDTIIPEIYAEFGSDVANKFVKTFSGRTINVPNYRDFCDTLLGGAVLSLSYGNKENLYRLADEYGIPYRSLARIFNKAIKFEEKKGD